MYMLKRDTSLPRAMTEILVCPGYGHEKNELETMSCQDAPMAPMCYNRHYIQPTESDKEPFSCDDQQTCYLK